MGKLIYSAITSLDGYVADADGKFDWGVPDEEVHAFVNDLERPIGTYLYGRGMYEVMLYWETAHTHAEQPAVERDFTGIWHGADWRGAPPLPHPDMTADGHTILRCSPPPDRVCQN